MNLAWIDVFQLIFPEIILGLGACTFFLAGTFGPTRNRCGLMALLALGLAIATFLLVPTPQPNTREIFTSSLALDSLALFTKIVALLGGIVLVLLSWHEVPDQQAAEYHACLLLIVAGLSLVGMANELVTLFLALELISIPTYVLLYLPKDDRPAQEAAMKYFLLSIFSSALLLFGFSYLYGIGGTTYLGGILEAMASTSQEGQAASGLASVALVMVVAGLGFRITAVPFHFYAPDVYQGTSPAAAALLAFIPKVAGFVALLRVLGFVAGGDAGSGLALSNQVPSLLWILAAVTMTLGNVLALLQDNLKRILAYSSVAHAGYMLMGLAVAPELLREPSGGIDALLFYLGAYGAMTIGAFGVLSYLYTDERPVETVDDLAGLSRTHPGVALGMGLFLFSLIGIPLTAGFAGKLLLFLGAMSVSPSRGGQAELFRILALIGAINAAIGAWYYLRIVMVMYLRTPIRPIPAIRSLPGLATLWICAVLTLLMGMYPGPFVEAARDAAGRGPRAQQLAAR